MTPNPIPEDPKPSFNLINVIAKIVVMGILLIAAGLALWTWASITFVYSKGERAGYVQKISKKGWIIKTWEGELVMVNMPGTVPEKFLFSVMDDSVAGDIQKTMGQRVILSYNEHRGVPVPIFGETSHFATAVQPQENPAAVLPYDKPLR